ncbi:MAG: glycosyltransferase, partial [Bacteroidetes bacterium]|nr:glycosyltransferase [Bacteroidota bacterium]
MANKKKLISIVIPVYNGEHSIGKLVDSIIEQLNNIFNLEIILVDDHSPDDNSLEVCKKLYAKYPNIVKFYALAKNVGEHNAVMAGLNNSNGNYVVI